MISNESFNDIGELGLFDIWYSSIVDFSSFLNSGLGNYAFLVLTTCSQTHL